MDNIAFFRFLNRVNAILITLAAIAVLLLASGALLSLLPFAGEHLADVQHVAKDTGLTYEFGPLLGGIDGGHEGALDTLTGTHEAAMVLNRVNGRRLSSLASSGGGSAEGVNVLVLTLHDLKSHWLFQGLNRTILSTSAIYADGPGKSDSAVSALLFCVADADTNGDGAINESDNQTLYYYKPDKTPVAVKLLGPIRRITNIVQTGSNTLLVTYFNGTNDTVVIYDTDTFAPGLNAPLAAIPTH
ncbi:MAG TPA: hypothetical protein VGG48_12620 [Rhizomicrobium sp.]|jgi:hypothetical protein